MKYDVVMAEKKFPVNGDWNGEVWSRIEPLTLTRFMGTKPEHMPKTQAKVTYDDHAIYVIFRVEDRYVRAVAEKHQDSVCRDSCVEFFFTPGDNPSAGYFNLEVNCGGTILLHHQTCRGSADRKEINIEDCERIVLHHDLPRIVDPEISDPVTWTVACALPFDMLEKYASVVRPAPGTNWRANFYKCADQTSHPHWLTWVLVDLPRPDFHQPEYFGTLVFV